MASQSKYSQNPRQSLFKKVLSTLFDGIIVTFLGTVLSIITVTSVLGRISGFNESIQEIQTQVENIYEEYVGAKLAYYEIDENDDEVKTKLKNTTYVFEQWIDKQISLSYSYDQVSFNQAEITIDLGQHPSASLTNDEASYFFTTYNVDKAIDMSIYEGKTPLNYYKEEQLFVCINEDYFVDEDGQLPHMKTEQAIDLYQAIHEDGNTDIYNEFYTGFDQMNSNAFSIIRNYDVLEDYFTEYNAAYLRFARIELLALIINFTIAFVLLIVGPQVFTRDHITFGNLITKTRRITVMGHHPSVWALVGKNLFTLVRGVLPFFVMGIIAFDFSVFTIPLFSIGSITVNVLGTLAIALIIEMVNAGFEIFRQDHRSLEEYETRTELVTKEMDFEKKEEDNEVDQGGPIDVRNERL